MGKILTRTERAETECPAVIMAAPVANMAMPNSTWINGNGYKQDMALDAQKSSTKCDDQHVNDCTVDVNIDSAEHRRKRTGDEESLSLESFSDSQHFGNPWNHSISCDDDYQPYEIDQAEEIPYWPNYDCMDNNTHANNTYYISPLQPKSGISDQDTTLKPLYVQEKDRNKISTKTEKKIQSLKVLLAEQEKAISRLKNESKEKIFESKEFLASLKKDQGCSLGKVLSENGRDISVKNHKLITKKDLEHKASATCTSRKRTGTEHTVLSNTKRFRYNFRKDLSQDIKSYVDRKTDKTLTLFKDKFTFEYVKADIRKDVFSQEEFLSFLGLVRTARVVSRCCQEMV